MERHKELSPEEKRHARQITSPQIPDIQTVTKIKIQPIFPPGTEATFIEVKPGDLADDLFKQVADSGAPKYAEVTLVRGESVTVQAETK
jgi:hypothetical protein